MAGSKKFAEGTKVSITASKAEIEKTLTRYGCESFAFSQSGTEGRVAFQAQGLLVAFVVPMPLDDDPEICRKHLGGGTYGRRPPGEIQTAIEREARRRWRALALAIKAKLEAVSSGLVTFEEEFLAHVLLPDGAPAATRFVPAIRTAYETGGMPDVPLLVSGK